MNLMSKGALAAMTLALDFAAGEALENLWDTVWTVDSVQQVVMTQSEAPLPAAASVTDPGKQKTGGGVCKPAERSVMVMEVSALGTENKVTPKHVCIRAMSGEPDFAKALEVNTGPNPGN